MFVGIWNCSEAAAAAAARPASWRDLDSAEFVGGSEKRKRQFAWSTRARSYLIQAIECHCSERSQAAVLLYHSIRSLDSIINRDEASNSAATWRAQGRIILASYRLQVASFLAEQPARSLISFKVAGQIFFAEMAETDSAAIRLALVVWAERFVVSEQ